LAVGIWVGALTLINLFARLVLANALKAADIILACIKNESYQLLHILGVSAEGVQIGKSKIIQSQMNSRPEREKYSIALGPKHI
jgi:hypothetical protein